MKAICGRNYGLLSVVFFTEIIMDKKEITSQDELSVSESHEFVSDPKGTIWF
jgi:hypothetical protein